MSAGLFAVFHIFTLLSKQLVIAKGHGTINHVLLFRGINMANNENLKKGKATQFRTGEEQAKIASEGGKASGRARNLKARLKEWAEDGGYDKMLKMAETEIANGNTRMWELIRDTIGEKPNEKVDLSIEDESARLAHEYFASRYNKGVEE